MFYSKDLLLSKINSFFLPNIHPCCQDLGDRFSLTADQAAFGLNDFSIKETLIGDKCPTGGPCDAYHPYRAADGACNNLEMPLWGSANSAFQRTLLPQYSDGVWRPKVAKTGAALPSARLVSE